MKSPLLPWEVIERIIGYSSNDLNTLRSFSLTCRQLRPRSFGLMVSRVRLRSRQDVFKFCDHLQAKPSLGALVRAIVVDPVDFPPFPLLRILPNLSQITFISRVDRYAPVPRGIPRSSLTSYLCSGSRISTLHLSQTYRWTSQEFCRLLLAFKDVRELTCGEVQVVSTKSNALHTELLKQRLSQRLHLRSLIVGRMYDYEYWSSY